MLDLRGPSLSEQIDKYHTLIWEMPNETSRLQSGTGGKHALLQYIFSLPCRFDPIGKLMLKHRSFYAGNYNRDQEGETVSRPT